MKKYLPILAMVPMGGFVLFGFGWLFYILFPVSLWIIGFGISFWLFGWGLEKLEEYEK